MTQSSTMSGAPAAGGGSEIHGESHELAATNTILAFQRTRLAADRTLMSVIRTSLSLIGFGFTIYQFFRRLQAEKLLHEASRAPRNFGVALVYLGVGILTIGIVYHVHFMLGVRNMRTEMISRNLVRAQGGFPLSFTLISAILLLLIGLAAISSITFHIGPFE